jgi:hypothetical protein
MDAMLIVIVLALTATLVTMAIGLMTMSSGGQASQDFGTPLMWARVGFQALTLVLLIVAAYMHAHSG